MLDPRVESTCFCFDLASLSRFLSPLLCTLEAFFLSPLFRFCALSLVVASAEEKGQREKKEEEDGTSFYLVLYWCYMVFFFAFYYGVKCA